MKITQRLGIAGGKRRGSLAFYLKPSLGLVLALMALIAVASQSESTPYQIIVVKSKRLLLVQQGSQTIKKYSVAVGKGGAGDKRVAGDKHTPEGVYRVVNSRPSDNFHYFIQIDYPSRRDAMAGFKSGLISWEELVRIYEAHQKKNGIPPQQTRLGGFIGIHGIGKETRRKLAIHRNFNWTQGCIALTNAEIDDLRQFIRRGTKIVIVSTLSDTELLVDADIASSVFSIE